MWGRSNHSITSILQTPDSEGEENVVDLTGGEEDSSSGISQQQLKRLRRQAQAMLFWLSLRVRQLQLMVSHLKLNPTHAIRDFYLEHPTWTKASLVIQVCKKACVCSKTWGQWRRQYLMNNGKFDHDARGLAQFGWLLVNED